MNDEHLQKNQMSRSLSKIWLHVVFATKNRAPFIVCDKEEIIYKLISDQLVKMECEVVAINGMPDHVHLVFAANYKLSPMEIVKQIKGATSYYINKSGILPKKFDWQDAFRVFSISPSLVGKAKMYVDNQKRHHTKKTHQQECIEFVKGYTASEDESASEESF